MIVEALYGLQPFEVDRHETTVLQAHKIFLNQCDLRNNGLLQGVITKFGDMHCRCVECANCIIYLVGLPCCLLLESF